MKSVPVWIALLMIALAVPMILQKVPPNGFYGFRTPKTMASPRVWYASNRAAGINLAVAGMLSLVVWAGVRATHGASQANVAGMSALVVLLLCAFVLSMVQLHRM